MHANASWIACPPEAVVPVVRKAFVLNRPTSGAINVTGLGFFRLTVNGQRVTDDLFTPALTDYVRRDMRKWAYPLYDETTHRIRYLHYDIAPYLLDGENVLELTLAPGWWAQKDRIAEGDVSFGGQLIAWFDAKFTTADGEVHVFTDGTELWRDSERTFCSLFLGEHIDANFRAEEAVWKPVLPFPAPDAILEQQTCPSDGVIRTIVPRLMKTDGNRCMYDCGENITGVAEVTAGGRPGDKVILRFSEEVTPDGDPDFHSVGGTYLCRSGRKQIPEDVFTLSAEKFVFCPEFVWHGFRYVEVTGEIDSIRVLVIHTRVPVTSALQTSSEALSFLYDAYIRTQLDNIHGCIPSDCPHRERLGYTGDGQVVAPTAMMLLDTKEVYRKWIRDILDSQDILTGHVQHTAPAMGGGGGPGGWGCAIVNVPDAYYRHYGDLEMLKTCYPHMKAWMGYLKAHSTHGLVTSEEADGWCLGDWAALGETSISISYVNTCCEIDALRRMERIAGLLGLESDRQAYANYRGYAEDALRKAFYNSDTGSWADGLNSADAFAVWCGADTDGRALRNLLARTEKLGYFDTGFIGTEILSQVLIRSGHADLLYELLSTEKAGSYLYMKRAGATTIWEDYAGLDSHNHPMFGAPVLHIFDGFLGIGQEEDSAGYEKPVIRPQIPAKLSDLSGSVTLPIGVVSVSAQRIPSGIRFEISVPKDGIPFCYGNKTTVLPKGKTVLVY